MNRQKLSRLDGERRAQGTLVHLLCAVSVWRTVMTRVLPLCGAAAWWTALLCLLPGFLVAALFRFTMYLTGAATLPEAMRASLGRAGALLLSVTLAVLLAVDAASSITALITLFTQGVGTRGTPLTLAALTGAVLLLSLHREGLARGVHFLRFVMLAAFVLLAGFLLGDAKPDHLFPLYGDGRASAMAAAEAGLSLAWPVVLLLTYEPPRGRRRLTGGVLPVFLALGAVLLVILSIPHEQLIRQDGLAALLLLPTRYAPNALRVIALSLLMLTFFLAIGAAVQLGTTQLFASAQKAPGWLPYAVLTGLLLTQAGDSSTLWQCLGGIEPWLLTPLALLALFAWPIALNRRKCP